MVFLSGIVVGRGKTLAEYSTVEGNHLSVALKIIKSMNRKNKNVFSDHGQYVFTLKLNNDNIAFICMASNNTDLQLQNLFLDDMEAKFNKMYDPNDILYKDYSLNARFSPVIADLIAIYNIDHGYDSRTRKLDRQMTNIHVALVSNEELKITKLKNLEIRSPSFTLIFRKFKSTFFRKKNSFITFFMILIILCITSFIVYSSLFVDRKLI